MLLLFTVCLTSPGWVAQLLGASSVHQKAVGLIDSQSTYLGCGSDLRSGRTWEATDQCFSLFLKSINIYLSEDFKKVPQTSYPGVKDILLKGTWNCIIKK